jgi:hypothetical protein
MSEDRQRKPFAQVSMKEDNERVLKKHNQNSKHVAKKYLSNQRMSDIGGAS